MNEWLCPLQQIDERLWDGEDVCRSFMISHDFFLDTLFFHFYYLRLIRLFAHAETGAAYASVVNSRPSRLVNDESRPLDGGVTYTSLRAIAVACAHGMTTVCVLERIRAHRRLSIMDEQRTMASVNVPTSKAAKEFKAAPLSYRAAPTCQLHQKPPTNHPFDTTYFVRRLS